MAKFNGGFQSVELIGAVAKDVELRKTDGGESVLSFSLPIKSVLSAATRPEMPKGWEPQMTYNDKGELVVKLGEDGEPKGWQLTTWWRVTCWRDLADKMAGLLRKDVVVRVEGEPRGEAEDGTQNPRVYEGKDGYAHSSYELTARNIKILAFPDDFRSGGDGDGDEEEQPKTKSRPKVKGGNGASTGTDKPKSRMAAEDDCPF